SLADGTELTCGAVIITGGLGSFTAPPLPAAGAFAGTAVLFFVKELDRLSGHDVAIVAGGDSALDWALALQPIAKSVTLVHRRDKFRAHAATVARVQELPVQIVVNAEVSKLVGEDCVTGCEITVRGEAPRLVPADTVVAALGFTADLGP